MRNRPVPQSHEGILVQIRTWPALFVLDVHCSLGHAEGLHAVSPSVISDVIIQLVSSYHSRGHGEISCTNHDPVTGERKKKKHINQTWLNWLAVLQEKKETLYILTKALIFIVY